MPADRFLHRRAGRSDKVSSLTDLEYRVWTQYMLSADDFGIMPMTAAILQSDNYHLAGRPAKQLLRSLTQLVTVGLIRSFEHQRKTYVYQHDWQDWQKIGWAAKTINPAPPLESLSEKTKALFRLYPSGGKVPKKFSETTSEVLPPTRVMGNGLRETAVGNGLEGGAGETSPAYDVMLSDLAAAYPSNRRTSGYRTETAFLNEFQKDTRKAPVVFAEMLDNLENQKQGHEWRVKGMIPNLERWLRDGLWRQRHGAAPASTLVTDRTAGTLAAAAEILKGRAS